MASWKNQKPIPLQTAFANASVPGANPDESTADSQLISHDASMSAAMTSPAGSPGPPPAASAVAAASKQISVQDFSPAFLMASSQISRALFSHALLRDSLQGLYNFLSQASLQLEMS